MYIDSRTFFYISTILFIHVVSNCSLLIFLLLCNIHLLSIGQYSHRSVHVVILLMGTLFIAEVTDDAVVNIWVCFLMWTCMSFSRKFKPGLTLLGYRTFISLTVSDNAKLHSQMLESIFSVLVHILINTT